MSDAPNENENDNTKKTNMKIEPPDIAVIELDHWHVHLLNEGDVPTKNSQRGS